jgi:heme/copper-type cytochrome/quinol oxidase subunit 2
MVWGNIVLETITQVNFGIGFSNTKADVLIHLAQWQYWWWFWFSFLLALYYLLILRVLRFRTLKFRPRIATTYRPHGKWGDLIVCIIPISWCANIISNSNFILRMIEWQAESSIFTVRIRGKQWYWIYKFDLKTVTDILTTPKNVGRNKWQIVTPGDIQVADDYNHLLQLRSQNKWVQKFWNKELLRNTKVQKFHSFELEDLLAFNFYQNYKKLRSFEDMNTSNYFLSFSNVATSNNLNFFENLNFTINKNKKNWQTGAAIMDFFKSESVEDFQCTYLSYITRKTQRNTTNINREFFSFRNSSVSASAESDFANNARWSKRSSGVVSPLRLIKYPLSTKTDFTKVPTVFVTTTTAGGEQVSQGIIELFRFRYDESIETVKKKPTPHSGSLAIKQKRYKRRKFIYPRYRAIKEENGKPTKLVKYSGKPMLFENSYIVEADKSPTKQYNFFKKKKDRPELMSVGVSRRMLRTKRTLVLPAHVNITAITNSYDVIHSWFIPGLGLKMDCIPGRSTHHTFFIDNVGFYYGQCAEVCGRFHHHMPIRICALPFEHFLIWWHSFGLPKLLFTVNRKNYQNYYAMRKFVW